MNFGQIITKYRRAMGLTQEGLAQRLGVTNQAVSKWENGVTSPDISLLPDISRYFGITVDELLQAEKIDEREYFEECSRHSEALFRNGKRKEILPIWLEAHKTLPNSAEVKEMLG